MASPVFKTAWAAVRSPEGSTPFLLRHHLHSGPACATVLSGGPRLTTTGTPRFCSTA